MTEGEKLVWAAAYASEYLSHITSHELIGTSMDIPKCIESAWRAVVEMRESRQAVKEGWGESDDVFKMLQEMLK